MADTYAAPDPSQNVPRGVRQADLRQDQAGDSSAEEVLSALYEAEYAPLNRTIQRIGLDPSTAQDVVQEAFAKALRSWNHQADVSSTKPWVYRIAINTAIDQLRSGKLRGMLPQRMYVPQGSQFDSSEARDLTGTLMQGLTPQLRAVVVLFYFQRFRHEEIGEMLGIPRGTVASRLHTAMRHMRARADELAEREASLERGS
ncbi:MAG: RNA polymerase sigma factor [Candidatus Dormibacter sp.]|uniref:RNA polymerase sigma factor n=1 Tax=Candidatus Dormibacter sp. TaxID=2973982 RepID=UPI0026CE08D8